MRRLKKTQLISFQLPKKVKYPNFIPLHRDEQQCTLAEKDTEVYKIDTNIAVPSVPNKNTKIQENKGTCSLPFLNVVDSHITKYLIVRIFITSLCLYFAIQSYQVLVI